MACINRGDLDGLCDSMTDDHVFYVEGEEPTNGKERMRDAWRGYFDGFPNYQVFEDEVFENSLGVFIVGHTSGSHVPAEEETIEGEYSIPVRAQAQPAGKEQKEKVDKDDP